MLRIGLGHNPLEQGDVGIVVAHRVGLVFHQLVAPAPGGKAGVIPPGDGGVAGSSLQQMQIRRLAGGGIVNAGAGLDELLPHQDAQLIAEVIEAVLLDKSAAPDPNHVYMHGSRRLEGDLIPLPGNVAVDVVQGCHIHALDVDASAVDFVGIGQGPGGGVLVLQEAQTADALAEGGAVQLPCPLPEAEGHVIQVLLSRPVGPPQPGAWEGDGSLEPAPHYGNLYLPLGLPPEAGTDP